MTDVAIRGRCLQLTKFYPPHHGGMETTARDISEGLVRRHWDVEVLCANAENVSCFEPGPVPVTRAASWAQIASTSIAPSLFTALARLAPLQDVIHVHLPNPLANLALFAVRPQARIVVHWHSDIVKQRHLLKLYAPFQDWLLARADAILATSPPYADSSRWLQPYSHRIDFVPSCIADPDTKPGAALRVQRAAEIRRQYGGAKIVFALGRMTYYKGFDKLVRAAAGLDDNTVVLIGGQGELLQPLREIARALAVDHKVHFLGRIDDAELPAYYEAADIFCLPSLMRSEAFGLVIVEAMSFRRPVIATRIAGSGVPWVNLDGVTGLNVAPGDVQGLADAVRALMSDPDRRQRMGQAGRARFEREFSVESMIDKVDHIYARIRQKGARK